MAKILIVDDEEHIRLLYKQELTEEGYEVTLATNGKECLEIIDAENPDLIILDIRMPVMDGIETLGRIINKRKDIPVILNTAYSSYKDDFMTWAAEAYVVKSYDLSELKIKIQEIIGRKKGSP
jgi:two-component system response regulator (stage 0 sporulation protein F)